MYFIGVDLGTSAVKLLLYGDLRGKICNIVSKEYPLFFPHPGWSEQKPEDWYAMTIDGLKELLTQIPIRASWQVSALEDRCMDWLFWMTRIR